MIRSIHVGADAMVRLAGAVPHAATTWLRPMPVATSSHQLRRKLTTRALVVLPMDIRQKLGIAMENRGTKPSLS